MVGRLRPVVLVLLLPLLSGCPDSLGKKLRRPADSPVATPTNLSAAAYSLDVVLSWEDNAVGESGYRLEMSHGPFETSPVADVQILPAESTSFVLGSSKMVTYFRVFAVTDTLESDPSNVVRVAPAPQAVTAACESPTQAVVRWELVAGESGYRVQTSTDGGLGWNAGASAPAGAASVVVSGLVPDTEYLFRVLADFSDGAPGDPSTPVEILTLTTSVVLASITASGDMGKRVSFVRLPSGAEHLSHYDAVSTNVMYTTRLPNGTYSTTTVDSGPTGIEDVGADGTSIAVDGAGKVHILAHDVTGNTLRYTTNATGTWATAPVESRGGARPRILWNASTNTLRAIDQQSTNIEYFIRGSEPHWTAYDVVTSALDPSTVSDLAVESGGAAHVAMIVAHPPNTVVHGVNPSPSANWTLENIPLQSPAMTPDVLSLAVDSAGAAHLAIHDLLGQALWYATNASGSWVLEVIDRSPGADVGRACSLAVQPSSGRIHVSYYDATRKDLRYARKDPGGPWVRRLLDAVGDVGTATSITVDAAGGVAVAYRDETNRRLKIARGAP